MADRLFVSSLLGYGLATGAIIGLAAPIYYYYGGGSQSGIEFVRVITPSGSFIPGETSAPRLEAAVFGSNLTTAPGQAPNTNMRFYYGPVGTYHGNWSASSQAYYDRDDAGADIWYSYPPNLAPGVYRYVARAWKWSNPTSDLIGDLDGSGNGVTPDQYGTLTVGAPADPTMFLNGGFYLPFQLRTNRTSSGNVYLYNNGFATLTNVTLRVRSESGALLLAPGGGAPVEFYDFTVANLLGQSTYFDTVSFNTGTGGTINFQLQLLQAGPGSNVKRTLGTGSIFVGTSIDPNEKLGPPGLGPNRNVLPGPFAYRINFENLATATADAQEVLIEDEITFPYEPGSLIFGSYGWSNTVFPQSVPSNTFTASHDIAGNLRVDVTGSFDELASPPRIVWTFTTIDKATNNLPDFDGFLPPNDGTGIGEGFVTFTLTPALTLPLGTVIQNEALITFDDNAPISTSDAPNDGPWFNTLADLPPEIPAAPTPANGASDVDFRNTQLSSATAVGATEYDLYLWKNGDAKPSNPTVTGLLQPVYSPPADLDTNTTYRWQIVARNIWGDTSGAEWIFSTGISSNAENFMFY